MKKLCLSILLFSAFLMTTTPGFAVLPDEVLSDPKLETRAREISKDIRCLVCQNQSIDDSNADLARDLRIIVRERLTAGDSNQEVKDYLVARYGDYVLLTPPLNLETIFLWGGPFLLVVFGMGVIVLWYRSRAPGSAAATQEGSLSPDLSASERQRLAELMAEAPQSEPNKGGDK
ncbi:MAG: cytochrome c-type biogenesis protein CcmH [Alphaproteobacteria bacterium]|nr:cytochrome c-type biogenesis protein CcmH [Alphaproteobacteria bacterium]